MQQVSRQILLSGGLPPTLELKKGTRLPPWFTKAVMDSTEQHGWWQVYLDNFMAGERTAAGCDALNQALQSMAMKAWGGAGVLTADDKQVLSSSEVPELEIRLICWELLPSRFSKPCCPQ